MTGGMKNASFPRRLRWAIADIWVVMRRERSFRAQLVAATDIAPCAAWLRVGWLSAAVLVGAAAGVLALEAMNAALGYLADQVHPDHATGIGHAKDAAGGAVVIASVGAAMTGLLVLLDAYSSRP